MIVGENSVVIDKPVADAFAFVCDPMNEPIWHPDVTEVRSTSDPTLGLGTRLVWEVKFMGREEYTLEVTAFEPNRCIERTTRTGRGRPRLTHRFEPAERGTRYTRRVEIQPEGLVRFMEPVTWRMHRRETLSSPRT